MIYILASVFLVGLPVFLVISLNLLAISEYSMFASLSSFLFMVSMPYLFQLILTGSSLPVQLQKFKTWNEKRFVLNTFSNSLLLSMIFPFSIAFIGVSGIITWGSSADGIGMFISASLITSLYLGVLYISSIFDSIKNHLDARDKFISQKYSSLWVCMSSIIIINLNIIFLCIAIDWNIGGYATNDYPISNYLAAVVKSIIVDENFGSNIIVILSIIIPLSLIYQILDKTYSIKNTLSMPTFLGILSPIYLSTYCILQIIAYLTTFGGSVPPTTGSIIQTSINISQLGFRFLTVLFVIVIYNSITEKTKQSIQKFELSDNSLRNKVFAIFLAIVFSSGFYLVTTRSGLPPELTIIAFIVSCIPLYISKQINKIEFLVQDRTDILIREKKNIKREKENAEKILFNVLPKSVAIELNENGIVLPKGFKAVTILFSDFKNFTNTSSTMSPEKLVGELNELFHLFDDAIEEVGVEKIKTIGDSYMVASGVPNDDKSHAEKCIETGFQMMQKLNERNNNTGIKWDMRVGIHTGSVVAGLVGKSRFTYDLWGDTVNIASRMEASSEPGRINISGITYDLVKDLYDFDYRGKVDIKGKGEIDMYFVNKRLDE